MSVAPGRVGEEKALLVPDRPRESLGTVRRVNLAERFVGVELVRAEVGNNRIDCGAGGTGGAKGRLRTVDRDLRNVLENLLSAVLGSGGSEEVRVLADEGGGYGLVKEFIMLWRSGAAS